MESFLVEMLRLHLAAFTSLLRSSAENAGMCVVHLYGDSCLSYLGKVLLEERRWE